MGRRLGLWLLALGTGVPLLLAPAFASPSSDSRPGGTLRLMWGQAPDSVDTALANGDVGSWLLLSATCATLFTTVQDSDSGAPRVVPEIARDFPAVSNNGHTYTFELKRTFRFHTGAAVTAQSFVEAFNRDAVMRSPVVSRGFVQEIIGADAAARGQAKAISGVQALGRYRLRIRLKRRAADFVSRLTMPYFCPIAPGTPRARIDVAPGSGPYYIADHIANRRIVLERNPYYRGGRTANPDRIVWTIEPDFTERLRATEQDENDFVLLFNYPDSVVRRLVDEHGVNRSGGRVFRLERRFSDTKFLFRFNLDRPAFRGAGQAPLRKAINYVIDRPELARQYGYLATSPSDRVLPALLSDSRRLYPIAGTAPVAAGRWLARARRPVRKLTLYTTNFPFDVKSAQVFVFNLRQLGIEVEPHYFDFQTLREKLGTPGEPWDVARAGGTADYPDPAAILVPLLRGTRYEARVDAANRMIDPSARAKAWSDLEADLMRDDPPVAAYADWRPLFFVSRSFGCWRPG